MNLLIEISWTISMECELVIHYLSIINYLECECVSNYLFIIIYLQNVNELFTLFSNNYLCERVIYYLFMIYERSLCELIML